MDTKALLSRRVRDSAMPSHGLRRIGEPGMILFGGGLPDPVTHPAEDLAQLIQEILGSGQPMLGYGYEQGDESLRELIADRHACGIDAANVVLTNGCAGAIGLVATALINPGDIVIVEAATYPGAIKAFRQMGAEIAAAPMDAQGLDLSGLSALFEMLARSGRQAKFLYTIASCQNPTATTLSADCRREVLRLAERYGTLVVEDATYADIRFGEPSPTFLSLDQNRVIHLGSFSKTIAPGLRLGWAAASHPLVEALTQVRTDLGASALLQRSVAHYIGDGLFDLHIPQITAHYQKKRDVMLAALERYCSDFVEWQTPMGGFFVWLTLRGGEVGSLLDEAERERVSFVPGSYFAAEPGSLDQGLRLSYGEVSEAAIGEGIARLAQSLKRMRSR